MGLKVMVITCRTCGGRGRYQQFVGQDRFEWVTCTSCGGTKTKRVHLGANWAPPKK